VRHCYESTALVGAEDHFGPRAGVGTGPYSAFVHSGVFTRVDCYENVISRVGWGPTVNTAPSDEGAGNCRFEAID